MTKVDGSWPCSDCGYLTATKSHLYEQVDSKHVSSAYYCQYCQKFCPPRNALRSHVWRNHPQIKWFQYTIQECCTKNHHFPLNLDMADDMAGMEAPGTRAPRALGHLFFFWWFFLMCAVILYRPSGEEKGQALGYLGTPPLKPTISILHSGILPSRKEKRSQALGHSGTFKNWHSSAAPAADCQLFSYVQSHLNYYIYII